jgi:hypothetical protein
MRGSDLKNLQAMYDVGLCHDKWKGPPHEDSVTLSKPADSAETLNLKPRSSKIESKSAYEV